MDKKIESEIEIGFMLGLIWVYYYSEVNGDFESRLITPISHIKNPSYLQHSPTY